MLRIIVLNYKRPKNVYTILNTLGSKYPITIVNNNPDEPLPYSLLNAEVINNTKNYFCMERWHRCFEFDEPYKLVIDDDILLSLSVIKKMIQKDELMVGIYGKNGVSESNNYAELENVWLEDKKVDFLVGSAILIKQVALDAIKEDILKIGYPERGDDILVSYLIKRKFGLDKLSTVSGKVLNLPEGSVGLNKDGEHFTKRWKVIQNFKNIGWTN